MVDFREERASTGPVITAITADGFRLDGIGTASVRMSGAILLTPVSANPWLAPTLDALSLDHLAPLLEMDRPAEFILLGTGVSLQHPARSLVNQLEDQGIGLEVMDSRAAARAWAVLRAEERWIAAAIMAPN